MVLYVHTALSWTCTIPSTTWIQNIITCMTTVQFLWYEPNPSLIELSYEPTTQTATPEGNKVTVNNLHTSTF